MPPLILDSKNSRGPQVKQDFSPFQKGQALQGVWLQNKLQLTFKVFDPLAILSDKPKQTDSKKHCFGDLIFADK